MTTLERLYEEARAIGIAVEHFSLPQTSSCAVCIDGNYYIGIDRHRLDTSSEETECLAHEIGHCQTDAFYTVNATQRKRAEKKAEIWAIEKLVPRKRFDKAIANGCREIWEFAEYLNLTHRFAEKVVAYYLHLT